MVVNHHLLCADLAVKDGSYGQVIPPYDTLILDEAHLIEDVATQYFGVHVSSHRVEELCARRGARAQGGEARRARGAGRGGGRPPARRPASSGSSPAGAAGRLGPGWMTARVAEESLGLLQRLEGLRTALLAVPDRPEALTGLAGRALALAGELAFLMRAEADDHVYFVETRGRGVFLRAMPIDVSARLQGRAVRRGAGGRSHLGHPGGGRRLHLREGPPRHRADRGAAARLALPLRGAGGPLRAEGHAGAPVAGVRGARGGGGGAAPRALARPRLRALHLLREHERGGCR